MFFFFFLVSEHPLIAALVRSLWIVVVASFQVCEVNFCKSLYFQVALLQSVFWFFLCTFFVYVAFLCGSFVSCHQLCCSANICLVVLLVFQVSVVYISTAFFFP